MHVLITVVIELFTQSLCHIFLAHDCTCLTGVTRSDKEELFEYVLESLKSINYLLNDIVITFIYRQM